MTGEPSLSALLRSAGADPGRADEVDRAVRAAMADERRRYHTLTHVTEVLAELDRLLPGEPAAESSAVRLAAWFHDVVQEPGAAAGTDEAASADLAADRLAAAGVAPALADEVARLVRLTAGHDVEPHDRSGAVLVDADLWILSAPIERYDRYVVDVRAEYPEVADDAWALGRAAVLQRFVDHLDRCFTAGPAEDRERRRAAARRNLTRELAALDG